MHQLENRRYYVLLEHHQDLLKHQLMFLTSQVYLLAIKMHYK